MRTACIVSLAALLSLNASAQIGENKDPDLDPPAWAMIDDSLGHVLGLTHEQMKQVQTADEQYRANRKAGDASAMAKREKDIQAILMPSQYEDWKAIERKRRETTVQ